jgi:hypothetical protein
MISGLVLVNARRRQPVVMHFLRSSVEGQLFSSDRHLAVCRDRYLYLFSVCAHIHFGIHVQIYDRKALRPRFLTWSARSNIAPHTVSFCRCPSTCCISIAPFSFSCANKPILIKLPPTGTNTCVEDIDKKRKKGVIHKGCQIHSWVSDYP